MSALDLSLSSALAAAKPAATAAQPKTAAGIDKAAKDFEAVFINEMMSSMFSEVKTDGPFSGGPGADMFRSMMVDQYSKSIASQGGLGLGPAIKREMLSLQEKAQGVTRQ